jgi:hypothetical protein
LPNKLLAAPEVTELTLHSRFKGDELVAIKPEGTEETFTVQKALLTNASDYFVAALDGRFEEADKLILTLPGTDVEAVRLFIYWLTLRKLPDFATKATSLLIGSEERRSLEGDKQSALINLWVSR